MHSQIWQADYGGRETGYCPGQSEGRSRQFWQVFSGNGEVLSLDAILLRGREVINHEARALRALSRNLDLSFVEAVRLILETPPSGRLILSGMGKAGLIANKIAATFSSLGVPSFSVHPAEAAHGDLGSIAASDPVIALSNSGTTSEVVELVCRLKEAGNPIIAITGNVNSALARNATTVLDIGNCREIGPLGVAPTTSTTVMLALGDALASSVSEIRGITDQQFACFHPGGKIGKTLLPITAVMRSGSQLCTVQENCSTQDVVCRMNKTPGRPGCAVVVDQIGKLRGIFTDGDLSRCVSSGDRDFVDRPVRELMTRNPKTVGRESLVRDALKVLADNQIDQVLVIDSCGIPIGLVDVQDLR